MKVKGYKYYVIWDKNNVIVNPNDFKQEVNEEATVEIYDTFGTVKGFNSLKQLEKFITDNNLTFPEEVVEINPFDSEWSTNYPSANVRMFIDAVNAMRLSIEQPEFVMLLKQRNINLIVDEDYEGTWAYLEEIESEHKQFLELPKESGGYETKFEYRN